MATAVVIAGRMHYYCVERTAPGESTIPPTQTTHSSGVYAVRRNNYLPDPSTAVPYTIISRLLFLDGSLSLLGVYTHGDHLFVVALARVATNGWRWVAEDDVLWG